MQSEESTTTSVTLDTMQYASQAQGSGVLDPTTIEQGAFEAAMDHPDEHGMKRQADSDDGGGGEVVEDRPKKKNAREGENRNEVYREQAKEVYNV